MNAPNHPKGEIARLDKEVHERDIQSMAESRQFGEHVTFDVESGKWAIVNSDGEALNQLRS